MAEIIGLHGNVAPLDNGAEPDVIALLETILARAKAGQVAAVALITVDANEGIGSWSRNPRGYRHALVAGAHYLLSDLAADYRDAPILG